MATWFTEQRLLWIKESLELFGFIGRDQIMRKFDISSAQASLDLRDAMERWPALMTYDTSARRYVFAGKMPEVWHG
jgi:hypothetical protein